MSYYDIEKNWENFKRTNDNLNSMSFITELKNDTSKIGRLYFDNFKFGDPLEKENYKVGSDPS